MTIKIHAQAELGRDSRDLELECSLGQRRLLLVQGRTARRIYLAGTNYFYFG